MFNIKLSMYYIIAQDIIELLGSSAVSVNGVLEYRFNDIDVLFLIEVCYSELGGVEFNRWMFLGFSGGVRCATNFDIDILKGCCDEQ